VISEQRQVTRPEPHANVPEPRGNRDWLPLLYLFLAVLAVKGIFFALDRDPKFMLGDSASYLWTAISGWIPYDRSFAYGFLLGPMAVWPGSLTVMVMTQTCLGAIAAWIAGFCLIRYFNARLWIAAPVALLCAAEPLQLFSERMVMTEAVSTFLFAVYVALGLGYLKRGSLLVLGLAQIVSVALISIRLSYLPIVVANSLLLPLLGPEARPMRTGVWQRLRRAGKPLGASRPGLNARWFAIHLAISVILSQGLLYGYRVKNSELTGFSPAYLYTDGPFLLGDWAPIVEPSDVGDPALRKKIFDPLTVPLKPRAARDAHHFAPGGLRSTIEAATKKWDGSVDVVRANDVAKQIAIHAAERDPLGLIKLSVETFADYFNVSYFLSSIELYEGAHHQVPKQFSDEIWKYFHARYQQLNPGSLTQRWHHAAVPWYLFLLFVPLIFTCLALMAQRLYAPQWIFLGIMAWAVVFQAAALSAGPTERYLMPLAWLAFPMMGAVAASCFSRWGARKSA
jgi:hypothetical protein